MKYNNLQQIGKSVIIYKQLFYTNDGRKASMQKKRYHKVQGEKSQRLTAFLLATTLTIGTAPMALAAQQQDILNGTQISSLTETAYVNAYTNTERMMNFNDHWRFYLGDVAGAQSPTFNDASWKDVNLPHDYSIEQAYTSSGEAESGYLPGGVGWYRKTFTVDPSWKRTKRLSVHFDGVYMNAEVYLNGQKLGTHPYGYTAFSLELPTDILKDGENVLAVKVNNKVPSSRWYSGSGIYRDVTMVVTNPVYVAPNGVSVITPDIAQKKGTVNLKTKIVNDSGEMTENLLIESKIIKKGSDTILAEATTPVAALNDAQTMDIESQLHVQNPELWNVWDKGEQNLYIARTEIKKDGQVIDAYETEFGFRYFDFDVNNGFSLNGDRMKLRGVCMHHDQGALGSEAWKRAMERQVDILKEMGCNAIRVTHNPAAQTLIDICNEKGMLVIDEAFDTWSNPKNGNSNDFSGYFKQTVGEGNHIQGTNPNMTWAEYDVKAMVERGKNAPSVIMWSLGNEIFEGLDGSADSADYPQLAQNLIDWIQEVDTSRPVTIGDNKRSTGDDTPGKVMEVVAQENGIVGFNYANEQQIAAGHEKGWKMYGSETASAVNSRGVYTYTGSGKQEDGTFQGVTQTNDQLLTAYDRSRVGWGAVASDAWWRTIRHDYNAGEFIWTGFDYLGEPTPWNGTSPGSATNDFGVAPKSSYFGIIDTTGFPKDSYYLYQSLWNNKINTLHILPTWNEADVQKDENGKVEVVVYSDAPVIKLYLNEQEIGVAKAQVHDSDTKQYQYQTYVASTMKDGENTFVNNTGHESLYATFKVPYVAGNLTAKAFEADGKTEITETTGRSSVETTGVAKKLAVFADRQQITADGKDLSYITVDVEDENGRFVNGAEPEISVDIQGEGRIVGVDNGKQSDHTPYESTTRNAAKGKLLVIVQSTEKAGEVTLTAKANGLEAGSVTVKTATDLQNTADDLAVSSVEYSKNYYVKVGNAPQLPKQLKVNFENAKSENKNVTWNTKNLNTNVAGVTKVEGSVELGKDKNLQIFVNVIMVDDVVALKNYATAVPVGSATANLPQTLPAILADGTLSEASFPVTWDESTLDLKTPNTYVITGTAKVFGQEMHPTATVRVSKGEVMLSGNVAAKAAEIFVDDQSQTSAFDAIRDGKKETTDACWHGQGEVKFRYDTAQNMGKVKLYLKNPVPTNDAIKIEWSADGKIWNDAQPTVEETKEGDLTVRTYSFDLVSAVWMKLRFDDNVQLIESELITGTPIFGFGSNDALSSLQVGTYIASEQDLQNMTLTVPKTDITAADVQAVSDDNASITILPIKDDVIRIFTESEDHNANRVYTIHFDENK